jgi:ATP-binding cassette, subfamily B, bacterial
LQKETHIDMKQRESMSYGRLLKSYLRPQTGRMALLSALALSGIALQLINPQLVRRFLDGVEAGQTVRELLVTAVIFTLIALTAQGLKLTAAYVSQVVAWTATNELRADLALHCLRLDMTFHKTHKPGELIERVDGDVNQLANFFSQLLIQLTSNFLLMLGVLVLLWLIDWRIGLAITLLSAAGVLSLNWINNRLVPRWQALRQVSSELFGYLEEWLGGAEEIQTNAAAPYIMRRLYALLRDRWGKMQRAMRLNLLIMFLPTLIPGLAYLVVFWWGGHLFRSDVLTIGTVYVIFYYIDVMREPLWVIQRQIQDLQQAAASMNRIVALFAEQPTLHDGAETLPDGSLAVRFAGVTFQYADDAGAGMNGAGAGTNGAGANGAGANEASASNTAANNTAANNTAVLRDMSFTLQPGRTLGLLGRTGSGKSTLIRLLVRFYDPTAGAILLGDGDGRFTDLRHTSQAAIRQRIGLVTQDVQLFHASVRDNLTLFDDDIADERILTALDKLGLRPWLDNLPDGLDTRLEADESLSAGEAQLLALGRLFLSDPGLIILDEASARLDPATEQLLDQALQKLLANRTAIIIAHRLDTVQRADEIMVMGNGRVLEHAERTVLAADPRSHFYRLLQTGLEEPSDPKGFGNP